MKTRRRRLLAKPAAAGLVNHLTGAVAAWDSVEAIHLVAGGAMSAGVLHIIETHDSLLETADVFLIAAKGAIYGTN